jgi:hypothetical protein
MANTIEANVILVDTNAAFPQAKRIRSIKYIGNASGTAVITGGGSSSGDRVWEESGSTNVYNANVEIGDGDGVYVTLTNSAKVYLYLK